MSDKFQDSNQVIKIVGEFVGGACHDINNSILLIQGSSHMILSPNTKDEARKLAHESLLSKTQKIQESLNNLREILRDSNGDPIKQVEVEQIVKKTINLCQTRFKNHGFKFAVAISDNLKIDVQEIAVIQSLLILLNTSHDAIQNQKEKWVKVSVEEESSEIVIKIMDSGEALTKDQFHKLLSGEISEINNRTHMGLALANKIVQNNGGKLDYHNQDKYSVLVLRLPKHQRSSGQVITLTEYTWKETESREVTLEEQLKAS